MNKIEREINWD